MIVIRLPFADTSNADDMIAEPSYSDEYQAAVVQSPLLYSHHSSSRSGYESSLPLTEYQQQHQQHQQHQQQHQQQQQQPIESTPHYPGAQHEESPTPAAQNFLRSFFRDHRQLIPPLGHSRPYYQAGESLAIYPTRSSSPSPRHNSHRSVDSSLRAGATSSFDQSILGSGDFGVLRGGTFYQDNDPTLFRSSESSNDYSYYNKNGHGRPQSATYVQRYTYPEDQFAHFRDFADINTPSDPAFSQFVVVYANKNATLADVKRRRKEPKNIFEQLMLLDQEEGSQSRDWTGDYAGEDEAMPTPSKQELQKPGHKTKLQRTKLKKAYRKSLGAKLDQEQQSQDLNVDPLLALS